MKELRNAFVDEYAHFHADARSYAAFTNLFYLLNVATDAVGASAAGVAFRAVRSPHLNGTANVLFIVSGALAMVNPLLSSAVGNFVRKHALNSIAEQADLEGQFDYDKLRAARSRLQELIPTAEGKSTRIAGC